MNAQSSAAMVRAARENVEQLTAGQVVREMADNHAVLVDIREPDERAMNGVIPGAMHAPRGMLEFYADPDSPYHRPEFDRDVRLILHCASGGRSALAAETLMRMGYTNIAHLTGGLKEWKDTGQPVGSIGYASFG